MACTSSALVLFILLAEALATPSSPGLLPGLSLFDVLWGYSDMIAETILHSSSFLEALRAGNLTEGCYTDFIQQEALYLHKVSSILETSIRNVQHPDDIRALLRDTQRHYSSYCRTNQPGKTPDFGYGLVSGAGSLYQQWSQDGLKESAWTDRYKQAMEKHQDHIDVFKAVNIYREHMMSQKSLYKAASCDQETETGTGRGHW